MNHGLHGVSIAAFYGLIVLGLACSGLYRKLTPDMCVCLSYRLAFRRSCSHDVLSIARHFTTSRVIFFQQILLVFRYVLFILILYYSPRYRYENAKHAPHGYLVLFFAVVLTTIDVFAGITRTFRYALAIRRGDISFSVKGFWKSVILKREDGLLDNGSKGYGHEYTGLVAEPEELEMDAHELKAAGTAEGVDLEHDPGLSSPTEESTSRWVNESHGFHPHHSRRDSRHSDETLRELPSHVPRVKPPLLQRIGSGAFATAERVLVIMGYMQVISGIVTYTGICRDNYLNGCLAHLISMWRAL